MEDYHTCLHRYRGNSYPPAPFTSLTASMTQSCWGEAALAVLWSLLRVHLSVVKVGELILGLMKKSQDSSSWGPCLPSWWSTKDLSQWGGSYFSSKNKVSKLTAQDSYTPSWPWLPGDGASSRLPWTSQPSWLVCVMLHGLFFFGIEDYRGLFPARSDFPMSNIFPHLDLNLHPITGHSTWERSDRRITWSPPSEGTFTLAL